MNESYTPIITKLTTFLDNLFCKNQDTDTFTKPTRAQIVKSAKTLSHEITKISLLLSDLRAKPEYFQSIEETLDNIFSVYNGLSAYSGQSLFRLVQISFRKLIKSTLDVLLEFQKNEQSLGEDEENVISKQIIGMAWKCCEELEKVAIKNSTALILRGNEISSLIQDALEEVQEFSNKISSLEAQFGKLSVDKQEIDKDGRVVKNGEEKQDKEEEEEDLGEDDEDEDDEDYDDEDDIELLDKLTKQDVELVGQVVAIIEKSNNTLAIWNEMLASIDQPDSGEFDFTAEQITAAESITSQFNELSKNVDDIASAIYPLPNFPYCNSQISFLDLSIQNIITDIKSNFKLFNFDSKFENKLI